MLKYDEVHGWRLLGMELPRELLAAHLLNAKSTVRKFTVIRGIFAVVKIFTQATAPRRISVTGPLWPKNKTLEVGADQQKILRYWTKYAFFAKNL